MTFEKRFLLAMMKIFLWLRLMTVPGGFRPETVSRNPAQNTGPNCLRPRVIYIFRRHNRLAVLVLQRQYDQNHIRRGQRRIRDALRAVRL